MHVILHKTDTTYGRESQKKRIGPAFTPSLTVARTRRGRTVLETLAPGFVITGAETKILIIFKHGETGSPKICLVPVKERTLGRSQCYHKRSCLIITPDPREPGPQVARTPEAHLLGKDASSCARLWELLASPVS